MHTRRPQPFQSTEQLALTEPPAQLVRRLVLQMVRFVHHQDVGIWQHAAAAGHIGQQQRMIRDHHVALLCRPSCPREKAHADAVVRAPQRGARLGHRAQALPRLVLGRRETQLSPVACGRPRQPEQRLDQQHAVRWRQVARLQQHLPAPQAQIVVAALQHRRA